MLSQIFCCLGRRKWNSRITKPAILGRVRLGSIWNKNNWNNASKRLFGSYSHSGIPGFHSGYSAPRSRIAGIYSGIHSYSGIFPNERALRLIILVIANGTHDCALQQFPANHSGTPRYNVQLVKQCIKTISARLLFLSRKKRILFDPFH